MTSKRGNAVSSVLYFKDILKRESLIRGLIKSFFIALQLTAGKIIMRYGKPLKKDKKIIIFTNLYYTGNPRAVYERMFEREDLKEKYEVYWMTSNLDEYLRMKKEGLPVLYKHGLLSVKTYKNANLWVLAHRGAINLPPVIQSQYFKVRKIQLEHGVGPKATKGEDRGYHYYTATCVSSEFIRERHIKMWNAPAEKLFATGFARLDLLLNYLKRPKEEILKELGLPIGYRKVLLYAPTFDMGLWPWGDPYEGLNRVAEFLEKKNVLFLIRPHPYTVYDVKRVPKRKNVKFVPMHKYPDTQLLLAATDALVTDWSSIYTDFLVTRRPIVFLEVNTKFFLEERGKSEVPPELRPGIKVRNEDELYTALSKVIDEDYIPDKEFYEKCLRLIHGMPDGHYSDRVIEVIERIV